METVPFGYQIRDGKAMIDEQKAEMLHTIFEAYLSGDSLETAAKKAGLTMCHYSVKRMLQNTKYLGTAFYPSLVDRATFDQAAEEIKRRALRHQPKKRREPHRQKAMSFHMRQPETTYDDPWEQAAYLYSLIESEEKDHGNCEGYSSEKEDPALSRSAGKTEAQGSGLLPGVH